jgi:cytosine/adenosine deaminase-related metal-dependent hydrolase
MECVEFYAGLLIPSLVNAHCHIELSYLEGQVERRGGFAAFAAGVARTRNLFTPEQRKEAVARADEKMWLEGVGAVGDIANDVSAFEIKNQSPIRYFSFAEVFGLRSASVEALEPMLHNPETSLTPHSTYSLQDEIFRQLCRVGDAPLSIHFMESEGERELYKAYGGLHDWYQTQGWECDFLHYGSPAERIVASVPADRSVILVHNCCVTQRDIDIIMSHFTAPVYWVVCLGSNDYISGVMPDIDLLRRNGLNICIGTDSLASNESLSMIAELKRLKSYPLAEILKWATANGADALGYGDSLGRIEVGRRCGLAVIDALDYEKQSLTEQSTCRRIL